MLYGVGYTMLKDRQELAEQIRDASQAQDSFLVTIDGNSGSGKSTLSQNLQVLLDCTVIELDDFVEENRGGYLDSIDLEQLQQAILKLVAEKRLIIIDGICVAEVLCAIDIQSNLRVYVKKLLFGDYWRDEKNIYGKANTLEEKLAIEEKGIRDFSRLNDEAIPDDKPALTGMTRDIISYHWKFRPDENADIVFGNALESKWRE